MTFPTTSRPNARRCAWFRYTSSGFEVASPTKWKYYDGSLQPLGTFGHPGAGGVNHWIDRDHIPRGGPNRSARQLHRYHSRIWQIAVGVREGWNAALEFPRNGERRKDPNAGISGL